MKCNVCGKEFGSGAYCQNCGSDIITARGNYTGGGYGVPSQPHHDSISNEPAKPLQSKKSDINKNVSLPQNSDNMNGSMICYNCAEVIPSDSIFCPCCGMRLFVECPKCGHKYSSRFKICNQCGTNYQAAIEKEKEKEKEKKTILDRWIDLTGSYDGTKIQESKRKAISGHLVIPDGVTEIGNDAFRFCTGLTSIVIPDSVNKIEMGAFWGCTGLTSIDIPDNVTEIGECAFYRCTGLTSIVIPDSVKIIGQFAFIGCTGLTSIVIPDGVVEIGGESFRDTTSLTSIVISSNNPRFKSIGNCCLSKGGEKLIFGCKKSIIPDGVTEIGDHAFEGCKGLTSIVIPDSVKIIGAFAFFCCKGLTSIVIPDSMKIIEGWAFSGCAGLTSIEIPADCELKESSFDPITKVKRRKNKP